MAHHGSLFAGSRTLPGNQLNQMKASIWPGTRKIAKLVWRSSSSTEVIFGLGLMAWQRRRSPSAHIGDLRTVGHVNVSVCRFLHLRANLSEGRVAALFIEAAYLSLSDRCAGRPIWVRRPDARAGRLRIVL